MFEELAEWMRDNQGCTIRMRAAGETFMVELQSRASLKGVGFGSTLEKASRRAQNDFRVQAMERSRCEALRHQRVQ